MELVEAAAILCPGTAWNQRGDKLEQADDGTPRVPCPPMDQLQALCDTVAYKDKRAKEYPSLSDQLDALWKGGKDADGMKAKILLVKAKYPKP